MVDFEDDVCVSFFKFFQNKKRKSDSSLRFLIRAGAFDLRQLKVKSTKHHPQPGVPSQFHNLVINETVNYTSASCRILKPTTSKTEAVCLVATVSAFSTLCVLQAEYL